MIEMQGPRLFGLKQAAYIAKCLESGDSVFEIFKMFSGDVRLVQMWIDFMAYYQWILQTKDNGTDRWIVTDAGRKWLERIEGKNSVENTRG
jgi:hypothetical protein